MNKRITNNIMGVDFYMCNICGMLVYDSITTCDKCDIRICQKHNEEKYQIKDNNEYEDEDEYDNLCYWCFNEIENDTFVYKSIYGKCNELGKCNNPTN